MSGEDYREELGREWSWGWGWAPHLAPSVVALQGERGLSVPDQDTHSPV